MGVRSDIGGIGTRFPKWAVLLMSLAFIGLVGWLDNVTGTEVSLSPFYVIPIAACAWNAGLFAGLAVSVISMLAILIADGLLVRMTVLLWWDTAVHLSLFLIITAFVYKLRASYERERLLSRTDSLTGALNKRAFLEFASLEIERSRRFGRIFTIAYLDLDNFKEINDRFGHQAGDDLLQELISTVRSHTRILDIISRLGGDEFAVLLPETDEEAALAIFERIRTLFQERMAAIEYPVSISVGLFTFTKPPSSVEEMISKGDEMMYQAKKSGKNKICRACE